ncbi:hypothetical protein ACJ51O_22805 [Burkholderia pyrrocinia]|uniref:hypothetical protein n=1 Tax=Burkholderia pyrrocinia TaxID=60550 RepID=UPI001FB4E665|nr:hypothetical protein [Burkholderia pyrrocinia]UOB58642.1 hypothetical protein MRS60_17800 [Burkholderia pyrrocinia]
MHVQLVDETPCLCDGQRVVRRPDRHRADQPDRPHRLSLQARRVHGVDAQQSACRERRQALRDVLDEVEALAE